MDNKDKIFSIIDEFRTQDSTEEERSNYYPISIYCNECKKDSTKILSYDSVSIQFNAVNKLFSVSLGI